MKNQNGFATVLLLFLLPLVLAGTAALYVCFGLIEDLSASRNECRKQLALGLERMSVPLQQLLNLNPQASLLQTEYQIARAALVAATALGQPAAIAKATAKLQRVTTKMKILDKTQKALLQSASLILKVTDLQAQKALSTKSIGFIKNRPSRSKSSRVAVRPKSPGMAPIYVLDEPFETNQTLVHRWQSQYVLKTPLSNFLKAKGTFQNVCAVTLTKEKETWHSKIIEDKFSSKRSFF